MGYNTKFQGELKFTNNPTVEQLRKLQQFLGADCRKHPEWGMEHLTFIGLQLLDDFSGIEWDGSEKTYDLVEKINLILSEMKKEYPDFGLTGELRAQGDEIGDIWKLKFDAAGNAIRKDVLMDDSIITCPHCNRVFRLEDNHG